MHNCDYLIYSRHKEIVHEAMLGNHLSKPQPLLKEVDKAARPFLKWVGGKGQLIGSLDSHLPSELKRGELTTYVEPFVGGGAVFFHIAQRYNVNRFVLSDYNSDLVLSYWVVRENVDRLINSLFELQSKYLKLSDEKRERFYYKIRGDFNSVKVDTSCFSEAWILRATQLIFLNKTCFNGLFRVNSAGGFNVAFGRYENPKICDPDNLILVSHLLQHADIYLCDFEDVLHIIDESCFVYLDPPYRPISATSNFTGYSATNFTALDQHRLSVFCQRADASGAKILMSNSDPANIDPDDRFFHDFYPNFHIERTSANRMVNCRADKRGKITELLVMNYRNGIK